ncbi:MAG TPA: hypothetical protein VLJ17_16795 [Xanthobacteraceae bacterium]|nr:hypothetical protein [Xanthobacteraceae bacterium]
MTIAMGASRHGSLRGRGYSRHPLVDLEDRVLNKLGDVADAFARHKANDQDPRHDEGTLLGRSLGNVLAAQIYDREDPASFVAFRLYVGLGDGIFFVSAEQGDIAFRLFAAAADHLGSGFNFLRERRLKWQNYGHQRTVPQSPVDQEALEHVRFSSA